jgi:PAS domain S-box-containing protein
VGVAGVALPHGGSLPEEVWHRRHRAILALIWAHVVGIPVFAMIRGFGPAHSLLEAAPVAVFAVFAWPSGESRKFRSASAALGLLTSSAVLVHLSGGTIEMHFHFFVMVGILTLYEDWLPFGLAIGYVVAHHGLMGLIDPRSVYNHPAAWAHPWTWAAIHGAFVLAASAAYVTAWRITEEARARVADSYRQLHESERRFRGAFENAPLGVALVGLDGTFLRVNRALCQMVGRQEDDLLGLDFRAITHPEDLDVSGEAYRRLVAGETNKLHMEKRYVRPDGSLVWAQVSVSTVHNSLGLPLHFVTQFEDITERKRADEELRLTVEELRRTDTERRRLLGATVRASEDERIRIAAELHDGPIQRLTALDYKLEGAQFRLERTEVLSAAEAMRNVQDKLRTEVGALRTLMSDLRPPVLDERGLEAALVDYASAVEEQSGIACSVDGALEERLDRAHETVLYRVAQEALTNVVRHAGGSRARISLGSENGSVVLQISDDGSGFDVTKAADMGGKHHFGLMAMRERVEMLGGLLEVLSAPGAGTEIRVVVPRREGNR